MAKRAGKSKKAGRLLTARDWEAAARERLSRSAYDYYRSGAEAERALKRNERAFRRWVVW